MTTDDIDYVALGSVVRRAHHDVLGLEAEARAVVAAYQEQRRAAGYVELTPEDWTEFQRVLALLTPIMERQEAMIAARHARWAKQHAE